MVMSTENTSLIVTAHPDDETIFFSGLILSRPKTRWKVICVTDGNADGQGSKRYEDWTNACSTLGITDIEMLGYPDIFEKRLDISEISKKLTSIKVDCVFTHGVLGEYGHPHHQDVCMATHLAFSNQIDVYSVSHNCYPEIQIELTQDMWLKKMDIYSRCYRSETSRFIQMLPVTFHEGFTRVSLKEVDTIYRYFTGQSELDHSVLDVYKPVSTFLFDMAAPTDRPF